MQAHYKLIYFLFFFILLSSVYAEDCKRQTYNDNIPCKIYYQNTNCTNITIEIYNQTKLLDSKSMATENNFTCSYSFNNSGIGAYQIKYSSGDSGFISIINGIKMIYLLYFLLIVLITLLIYGLVQTDIWILSISAFGFFCFGIFIYSSGFAGTSNILTEYLSILFIGLGIFFLIPLIDYVGESLSY